MVPRSNLLVAPRLNFFSLVPLSMVVDDAISSKVMDKTKTWAAAPPFFAKEGGCRVYTATTRYFGCTIQENSSSPCNLNSKDLYWYYLVQDNVQVRGPWIWSLTYQGTHVHCKLLNLLSELSSNMMLWSSELLPVTLRKVLSIHSILLQDDRSWNGLDSRVLRTQSFHGFSNLVSKCCFTYIQGSPPEAWEGEVVASRLSKI